MSQCFSTTRKAEINETGCAFIRTEYAAMSYVNCTKPVPGGLSAGGDKP